MNLGLSIFVGLGLNLVVLWGGATKAVASEEEIARLLTSGAEAALLGQKNTALRDLQKAAILDPKSTDIQASLGLAALLLALVVFLCLLDNIWPPLRRRADAPLILG